SALEPHFDWRVLMSNKNNEIKRLNGIYKAILDNNDVALHEGRARLTGPHEIEVNGQRFTAANILLAVGGWPSPPDIPGKELMISSNDVFTMEALPDSLVILGGGYIAVEFASIFTRLGCKTTLIYRGDRLLRGFDEDLREFISTELGRNLDLVLGDNIKEILNKDKQLQVVLESGRELSAQAVMAATGRRPLTADLGLESTSVQLAGNGAIVVDEQFQTSEPGIYAVGDCIDRVALTPVALAEGQIVARNLFAAAEDELDYHNIPSAVFCHPNVGTVGLTEAGAEAAGFTVKCFLAQVRQLKHSLSGRDEMAFLKLVVDQDSDRVLGLHMAGPDAGELVQGFAVAMNCGATKADFDRTIGIHPTLAEELVTMRSERKRHSN
ncbi:MAG: FAD-dependent oxidoreductase, partial [Gammaproteobacteria bacterium]